MAHPARRDLKQHMNAEEKAECFRLLEQVEALDRKRHKIAAQITRIRARARQRALAAERGTPFVY